MWDEKYSWMWKSTISNKTATERSESNIRWPTFDENKFLTNRRTVAFDEIFRWRKFFAIQYLTGLRSIFVPYPFAVVSCPSLTAPNNARISAGDDSYKTERTFSCSSGYTSSGTDRRTCQANGKWSGNADFACTSKRVLTLILNPDP